jgi:hypothetical protein
LTGQNFDYESFQATYDSSPALQQIVADFSDHGITLNVDKKEPEQPAAAPSQHFGGIDGSAKTAAKHTLDRLK